MKKIVVVFHDNDLYSGGTSSFLTIIKYLKQQGYIIYAVIPNKKGKLESYLKSLSIKVDKINFGGNVYSANDTGLKKIKSYFRCYIKTIISYISCMKYAKYIKSQEIDLVYTNTSTIYFGYWLSKILKEKHIWHFREFCYEDQKSLRIFDSKFSKMANSSAHTITISNVLDNYYRDKYHINNSIMLYDDLEIESGNFSKIEHREINILITGTLSEGKGQLNAIRAIEKLNNKNVHLYVAGTMNQYGEMLKSYVSEKNIENIHFCGFVEDMVSLRKKMDFSVVCARSEAFGRTIIEDMLSEILVIAGDKGSVPELITNEENGLVYKYGDIESLVDRINFAINNPEIVFSCKKNAKEWSEKFITNRTAQAIEKIMEVL